MSDAAEAFADRFRGTIFEGWEVHEEPIPGGQVSFEMLVPAAWETTNDDVNLGLWREAVAQANDVGRWPLLYAYLSDGAYSRAEFQGVPPQGVIEMAADVSVEVGAASAYAWPGYDPADDIEFGLFNTGRVLAQLPTRDQLRALDADSSLPIERFLLHWERDHGVAVSSDPGFSPYLDWATYERYTDILWLPIDDSTDVAAYIAYYGGGETAAGNAMFLAHLKSWQERFGAQVVAHGGLTIDLWLERPPVDLDVAFDLAAEIALFRKMDVSIREAARTLVGRNRVQLYERP